MDVQAELRKLIGKRITVSDLRQTFQIDGKLGWDGCQFSVDRRYGSLPFRPEQAIRFHASATHPRWLFIERSYPHTERNPVRCRPTAPSWMP